MRNNTPGTVVITPNIPANVANAEAKESKAGYRASSSKHSYGLLETGQYNPNLGTKVTYKEVATRIRASQKLRHWLNFFLSLRFADKQYEEFTDKSGMSLEEFCRIAMNNYYLLYDDSKFNLAKISELGLNRLAKSSYLLLSFRWNKLIENDKCAITRYIANDKLFGPFYRKLNQDNQRTLRATLFESAKKSTRALATFLRLFDITTDECNTLVTRHNYNDFRLGSAETDRATLIGFLNSLRKDNRMAFVASNHPFLIDKEVGFLWSGDSLKCDDFTATDLIKILAMLESRDQRKIGAINLILSSLALTLIASAEDTLSELNKSKMLQDLFQRYPLFQSIIQHCALKKGYNENQAREAPIAFNQTDDLEYKKGGDVENILLKPLGYADMIRVAQTLLKNGSIDQAVSSYLQAMNRGNINVDPQLLIKVCKLTLGNKLHSNYDIVSGLISRHIEEELDNRHLDVDHQTLQSLRAMESTRKTLLQRSGKSFGISPRLVNYLMAYTRFVNDNYEANPLENRAPREFLVAQWRKITKLCEPGSQQHIDTLLWFATLNNDSNNDIYREVFNELNSIKISGATKNQIVCARLYFATALNPLNPDFKQCFLQGQEIQSLFFCLTKRVGVFDHNLMSIMSDTLAGRHGEELIGNLVLPLEFSDQQMGLLKAHFVKPEPVQPVFVAMPTSSASFDRQLVGRMLLSAGLATCVNVSILSIVATGFLSAALTFTLGPVGLVLAGIGILLLMKHNRSIPTPEGSEGYNSLFTLNSIPPPSAPPMREGEASPRCATSTYYPQ